MPILISLKANKVESNLELQNKMEALVRENELLKTQLNNFKTKFEALEKNFNKNCLSIKKSKFSKNKQIKELFSSFTELNSSLKTDPVFKSIVNFALPRQTSYLSLPGDKSNKMFAHIKVCPPGCIVGASS